MKRHTSRNSHRDEKPKPSRNEDSDAVLRAGTEEERRRLRRRRREWMIEQEKINRYNRLKRKVMEYKIRRARNMSLAFPEGICNRPHRSRSESPPSLHRRTSAHHTPEDTVLSKKFETSSGTTPLFKGSEGPKISLTELRKIKVDIRRNISGRVATDELMRDIPNKEDVVVKRRVGEGSKPIFDREEIKRAIGETENVEKHRSVVIVNLENSENKWETLKRFLASLSPTRTRSHSPRRAWSRHSREKDYSRERKDGERSYREPRERPRDHSRDRRETDRSRKRDRPREQRVPPGRSHRPRRAWSRHPRNVDSKHEDKGSYRSDREKYHSRERKDGERSYREHRERPRGHSRDRREADRSRKGDRPEEQMVPPERYDGPSPVPIYYGEDFQPRPLMVRPWAPIRRLLGSNIHPPMMRPLRIFPPRLGNIIGIRYPGIPRSRLFFGFQISRDFI